MRVASCTLLCIVIHLALFTHSRSLSTNRFRASASKSSIYRSINGARVRTTRLEAEEVPYLLAEEYASSLWSTQGGLFDTTVHCMIRCCAPDKEPAFTLAYMPMRNRHELSRLILEETQTPYEVEMIGFKAWSKNEGKVKGQAAYGKLPVLRNYDGKGNDLGQEGAITRYLAKTADSGRLAGRGDPILEAKIDSLYCFWVSTMRNNYISHDGEHFSIQALKDAVQANTVQDAAQRPRYESVFRLNTLSTAERSLLALDYFESLLKESTSGFLVGDDISYVDLGLFYILFELAEDDNVPHFESALQLSHCRAFVDGIVHRTHIKAYLESYARIPRYARDAKTGKGLYTYKAGRSTPIPPQ